MNIEKSKIEQTERERERQLKRLLAVSTDAEKSKIEVGRHAGRQLRRELESQEQEGAPSASN